MKVGIITHYDVHNHGAQLQLYALASTLKELGIEAKALRYNKNYDFLEKGIDAKYSISIRSVPIYAKYLIKHGVGRTIYNIEKRKMLNTFRLKNNLEGDFYSDAKDIECVVIGSDEIFSIESGLNPWFYGMGVPCNKVISYAASFGPTTVDFIKEHHAEEFVGAGINNINIISVRDQNSKDIVERYSNKTVTIVCDPVLLYNFSNKIEDKYIKKDYGEKYCIVYSYDNNMNDEETVTAIRNYAKRNGYKIYSVGYYHKWCDKNISANPLELLDIFGKSQMVFTDTFHGTVISLVSNAEFCTKVTFNKNKLQFLLEQYGVTDRKVISFTQIDELEKIKVDYNSINKTIEKIRNESLKYLKDALGVTND